MSAIRIFDGEDAAVPEGSSHEYSCRFAEASGAAILLGAITDIRGWLDDVASNTTINGRSSTSLLNAGGGTLVDAGDGSALFTWALDAADAPVLGAAAVEWHRITLKVTYSRAGGGTGVLTRDIRYRVIKLERI